MIAIPWLVLDRTGSAAAAGLLGALVSLPGIVVSPFVGALIDRVGRRSERGVLSRLVEQHRAGPAEVVERGDGRVHHPNDDQHQQPRLLRLDRAVEDVELGDEARRRRDAREREQAERQHDCHAR